MAGFSGIVPAYNRHANGNLTYLPEIPRFQLYGSGVSASTRAGLSSWPPGCAVIGRPTAYLRIVFRDRSPYPGIIPVE